MQWLTQENLADYLRCSGRIGPGEAVEVRELAGGVSNVVLYVRRLHADSAAEAETDADTAGDFVVKQAREQLRVAQPWFCRLERIWREVDVMRWCQQLLQTEGPPAANGTEPAKTNQPCGPAEPPGALAATTPRILWEDREQYCFAMTAAPANHTTWKTRLLAGQFQPEITAACGKLLGILHGGSWRGTAAAKAFGDRSLFDDLRLDPYYRTIAKRYPAYSGPLGRLIDSIEANLLALVHADFSPKNLLVYPAGLMMVDFETGHFGDPAFDLGFFLSHLVLKAHHHASHDAQAAAACQGLIAAFWEHYLGQLAAQVSAEERKELLARGIQHLAACAWARLDGKSPVDYLHDEDRRGAVRAACQQILAGGVTDWDDAAAILLPVSR